MRSMNALAKEICKIEGGKKSLDIAQVKEVLRILCILMFDDKELLIDVYRIGAKYGLKKKRRRIK